MRTRHESPRRCYAAVVFFFALSTTDASAATFVVRNTNATGADSLKAAIDAANASADPANRIEFDIPGPPPYTILLDQPLVIEKSETVIAGASEPDYVDTPVIVLFPGPAMTKVEGIRVNRGADNVEIRALYLTGFRDQRGAASAIHLLGRATLVEDCHLDNNNTGVFAVSSDANFINRNLIVNNGFGLFFFGSNNRIERNLIGIGMDGTPAGNRIGVAINEVGAGVAGADNTIGSTVPGSGNVISGNRTGIVLHGTVFASVTGTKIQGNFIGTDLNGMAAVGNEREGIRLRNAPGTLIGGSAAGASNVISGNGIGILSDGFTANPDVVIHNNFIGTDVNGVGALPNKGPGVQILDSSRHVVGGLGTNEANVIAYNFGSGVHVWRSVTARVAIQNPIRGNSIFENRGLGIDLAPNKGVTPNDAAPDGDDGANLRQNYPLLSLALSTGQVDGILTSKGNTTYDLDFYSNRKPDPTGHGEGEVHLGTMQVTTNAAGMVMFTFAAGPLAAGTCISSTATDPDRNTSEFSACLRVEGAEDSDGDGTPNGSDNCPNTPNDQSDGDGNGVGDDCDFGSSTLYVVGNASPSGAGSLADALALAGPNDHVRVMIPGPGPHVISLQNLAFVQGELECRTQEGWTAANHNVILDGSGLPASTPTAVVNGGRVYGCNFNGNPNSGVPAVQVQGTMPSEVSWTGFGVSADGMAAAANAGLCLGVVADFGSYVDNHFGGCGAGGILDLGMGNAFHDQMIGLNRRGDAPLAVTGSCFQAQGSDCLLGHSVLSACQGAPGVALLGAQGCRVEQTCVGTDASCASQVDLGVGTSGIIVQTAGNTTLVDLVSSGNALNGIDIVSSTGTQLTNALVGFDLDGYTGLSNGFGGITATSDSGTRIDRTQIGGHPQNGVVFDGSTTAQVCDSSIGLSFVAAVDAATPATGNAKSGIRFQGGASGNRVGACDPAGSGGALALVEPVTEAFGNVIAWNATGITLAADAGSGNAIRGNSVYSNSGLGIDLGGDGLVDPNDPGDADGGANMGQNAPVLTLSTGLSVLGTLDSAPDTIYRIEIFESDVCDASGAGEGKAFVGSGDVTTDAGGIAALDVPFSAQTTGGNAITATATDPLGNTSEYSNCVTAPVVPLGALSKWIVAAVLLALGIHRVGRFSSGRVQVPGR